eukprot:5155877-Pyramimonas_sp.AAC.1
MLRHLRGEPVVDITANAAERRRIILRSSAYTMEGTTLLRRMSNNTTREVPPKDRRELLIQQTHAGTANLGEKRCVYLLQVRFHWPKMWEDVHAVLVRCSECRKAESCLQGSGDTLHPLKVVSLFYRWHLDYLKLPRSKAGFCRVLIAVESLTRFAVFIPLTDKASATTAFTFRTHLFGLFGSCAEVVTDQGSEFKGEFEELLDELLIDHRHTSAYHPQANGLAERLVQLLKKAMRKCAGDPTLQHTWEKVVPTLMLAYNASKQSSTGLAPYTCLFAQVPTVPPEAKERFAEGIDVLLPPDNTHDGLLATELVRRMHLVRKAAGMCAHNLEIAQKRDITRYRKTHSGNWVAEQPKLAVGDYVLLRGQATDAWDLPRRKHIYKLTAMKPLDTVELQGSDGRTTTSHRSNIAKYPSNDVDPQM